MRNEAAERLLADDNIIGATDADYLTVEIGVARELINAARTAERLDVVERIRKALPVPFWSVGVAGSYFDADTVYAILDEAANPFGVASAYLDIQKLYDSMPGADIRKDSVGSSDPESTPGIEHEGRVLEGSGE